MYCLGYCLHILGNCVHECGKKHALLPYSYRGKPRPTVQSRFWQMLFNSFIWYLCWETKFTPVIKVTTLKSGTRIHAWLEMRPHRWRSFPDVIAIVVAIAGGGLVFRLLQVQISWEKACRRSILSFTNPHWKLRGLSGVLAAWNTVIGMLAIWVKSKHGKITLQCHWTVSSDNWTLQVSTKSCFSKPQLTDLLDVNHAEYEGHGNLQNY